MSRPQKPEEGEAAAFQHENPNRTSKLPSERVILLVLGSLLAVALIIICSLCETHLKCEAGWEPHGRTCYYFNIRRSSWNESRRSCRDLGGDLVKIDSREEQMFLQARLSGLMEDSEDIFWIGLTDSGEEGMWFWVDGSSLVERLSFWYLGQPDDLGANNLPGADCVRMGEEGGADDLKCWHDRGCDDPQKSICEKAAGFVQRSVVV